MISNMSSHLVMNAVIRSETMTVLNVFSILASPQSSARFIPFFLIGWYSAMELFSSSSSVVVEEEEART